MKAIREKIGDTDVLIQAMDDDELDILNSGSSTLIKTANIEDEIKDAYKKAKTIIKDMAEDFGKEFNNFRGNTHAQQMELEFSMGFSAEAKAWAVFGAKANSGLKVKLIWQADRS